MFPKQLKYAKDNGIPFILPIGTLEYHGPHCSYGCDGLIAEGLAKCIEKDCELVILPTFWYGTSSYAVAGPEKGTVDVSQQALTATFHDMFYSLLEGGIRNLCVIIHHQYEQESYMPLTLAAASAAKSATMQYLEKEYGRGWWGNPSSANYYDELNMSDNPFQWIRVFPCMSTKAQNQTGYDHAGKYETSLLAALYPDAVKLEDLKFSDEWFIQSAKDASAEYGKKMVDISVEELKKRIFNLT